MTRKQTKNSVIVELHILCCKLLAVETHANLSIEHKIEFRQRACWVYF